MAKVPGVLPSSINSLVSAMFCFTPATKASSVLHSLNSFDICIDPKVTGRSIFYVKHGVKSMVQSRLPDSQLTAFSFDCISSPRRLYSRVHWHVLFYSYGVGQLLVS